MSGKISFSLQDRGTITATTTFPIDGEIGKLSEAISEMKETAMLELNAWVAEAGNAADDVDLMEEVVEDNESGMGGGRAAGKSKKRKKGGKS